MMIKYVCNNSSCNNSISKYFSNKDKVVTILDCGQCSGKMERQIGSPTAHCSQIIDSGLQTKAVEITDATLERVQLRVENEDNIDD